MGSLYDLRSNNIDLDIRVDKLENDPSDTYYSVITDAPVPGLGRIHPLDATPILIAARDLEQEVEKAVGSGDDLADIRHPLNLRFVKMGDMLFNALFPLGSTSRSCFASCFRRVVNGELGPTKRLRLKLNVHETLHDLPWELLRYSGTDLSGRKEHFFLANHTNTAVVRYMGNTVWRSESALEQTPLQLGILVIVARPNFSDLPEREQKEFSDSVDREKQAILKTLQPLADAGQIRIRLVEGENTLSKLLQAADENTHILHYIGHGGYYSEHGSFLVGEDRLRYVAEIFSDDLASALRQSPNLRLLVLNACRLGRAHSDTLYGGVAFQLAQSLGVPALVAMKFSIRTETAEVFGKEFYGQLVSKRSSVYEALRFSCSQIYAMPNRIEWTTPLLIMSSINGMFVDFPLMTPGRALSVGLATEATSKESMAVEPLVTRMVETLPPPLVTEPEMVTIPAGESITGIDEKQANLIVKRIFSGGYNIADTTPGREEFKKRLLKERARKINLPAFLIDKFPVTNEEFERFVKATGYQTDAERRKEVETWHTYYESLAKAKHPIVCVSWNDANTYAKWAHKRLPTAEEWEKAARGPNGSLYPWGNDWDPLKCNNQGSMRGFQTTPVDAFESGKSTYGVYDIVGNVCEWTSIEIEGYRVVLGGSWQEACEIFGLTAFGRRSPPSLASNDLGFRCVRDS